MANVTERATNISFGVSGQTNQVMPSEVIDPAPPGQRSMYHVSVMQRSQRGALVGEETAAFLAMMHVSSTHMDVKWMSLELIIMS